MQYLWDPYLGTPYFLGRQWIALTLLANLAGTEDKMPVSSRKPQACFILLNKHWHDVAAVCSCQCHWYKWEIPG